MLIIPTLLHLLIAQSEIFHDTFELGLLVSGEWVVWLLAGQAACIALLEQLAGRA